jgi:hypothetical protein
MAFQINGSDIINANKQYTTSANVSVTDSIIIANNDSLDSGDGYSLNGTLVMGESGLAFSDVTLKDATIEVTGPLFQGTVSGYTSGSRSPTQIRGTYIQKFSFASDGNGTDIADLTVGREGAAGQSSEVSGYTSGGRFGPPIYNVIDKFPFAVDANATDVGDLTLATRWAAGQSTITNGSGYTSGGGSPPTITTISKFPFVSDSNATFVGNLSASRYSAAGQSSAEFGYTSGGSGGGFPAPRLNVVDKFPFASNANATDVGDLTQGRYGSAGQSSRISGYNSGGDRFPTTPVFSDTIDKFPFASDANATDVGNLTAGRYRLSGGQSSTVSGYSSGGRAPGLAALVIDKFPFASDANATDVGDLQREATFSAGQQV